MINWALDMCYRLGDFWCEISKPLELSLCTIELCTPIDISTG